MACSCNSNVEIERLRSLCERKDSQIKHLEGLLDIQKGQNGKTSETVGSLKVSSATNNQFLKDVPTEVPNIASLTLQQYEFSRYSRQLLLPEISVHGQTLLKKTSVLIIGAGGLGCPVGMYLAAAGVGKIGIVDYDVLEISNLHRQVIHKEKFIGDSKCKSFIAAVNDLNSTVYCVPHETLLNSRNAKEIIIAYDIIVDASDNVPTRYLLNDACVLFKKPLVSGSALKFEGQLTIYNFDDGPCYRCLFPVPPPPHATINCSEGGVVGAVTGVIGSLQALEVIKIACGIGPSYNKKLLIFDGKSGEFHNVKLRPKNPNCIVCGKFPTLTELIDYEKFCHTSASDRVETLEILSEKERISCTSFKTILDSNFPHVLLDVRPTNEIAICSLPNHVNIPISKLDKEENIQYLITLIKEKKCSENFVICRRGNDSQIAVKILQEVTKDMSISWRDIKGGLVAWHNEVDSSFPLY